MKILKNMMRAAGKKENAQVRHYKKENGQYTDNYIMLGSILGGFCSMLGSNDHHR